MRRGPATQPSSPPAAAASSSPAASEPQRRTNGYAHESSGKPWYCGIMIQKHPSQCATSSVMLKNLMHMMSPCFTSIST